MHGQRGRLLGSGILLLFASTLALAACNSDSVSRSSQGGKGANGTTAAQSTAPTQAPASKGKLLGAVAGKIGNAQ